MIHSDHNIQYSPCALGSVQRNTALGTVFLHSLGRISLLIYAENGRASPQNSCPWKSLDPWGMNFPIHPSSRQYTDTIWFASYLKLHYITMQNIVETWAKLFHIARVARTNWWFLHSAIVMLQHFYQNGLKFISFLGNEWHSSPDMKLTNKKRIDLFGQSKTEGEVNLWVWKQI